MQHRPQNIDCLFFEAKEELTSENSERLENFSSIENTKKTRFCSIFEIRSENNSQNYLAFEYEDQRFEPEKDTSIPNHLHQTQKN